MFTSNIGGGTKSSIEYINDEIKHNVDGVKLAYEIYNDELKRVPILAKENVRKKYNKKK